MDDQIQLGQPSEDYECMIRRLLSDIFTEFAEKRTQLAEALSGRARRRISCSMLNAFAAPSNETARFPASLIIPLCDITGDDQLQRFVMGPRLRALLEFAERELSGIRDLREREALRETLLRDLPKIGGSK